MRKAIYSEKVCKLCSKRFSASKSNATYCSIACRVAEFRIRAKVREKLVATYPTFDFAKTLHIAPPFAEQEVRPQTNDHPNDSTPIEQPSETTKRRPRKGRVEPLPLPEVSERPLKGKGKLSEPFQRLRTKVIAAGKIEKQKKRLRTTEGGNRSRKKRALAPALTTAKKPQAKAKPPGGAKAKAV